MNAIGHGARLTGDEVLITAVGLAVAVAIGWLASTTNPLYALVPAALAAALYFAAHPPWLLWAALLGGLVVAGLAKLYAPPLELVRWALAPIAVALALHALWQTLGRRWIDDPPPLPAAVPWALAFIGVAIVASLAGAFTAERLAVGLKGYFQVWGLLFALAFFPWPERFVDRLPRVFLAIALAQLPFVLHQLLVLVPQRVGLGGGIVPIDIVSGTFGASLEGGGANAILNAFLVIVIAGLVAARQLGVLSTPRLLLFAIPLALPILVNEAKVSVFYLIAALAVLFGRDLMRRPLRFLAAGVVGGALLAVLMTAYTVNAPNHERIDSWQDLVVYTWEYNVTSDKVNGELSRFGALAFWAERQGLDDIQGLLLGHGVGYTRVADAGGDFRAMVATTTGGIPDALDLDTRIGNTAIAALLWETGLLGLFCILGLLAATYRAAGRLEHVYQDAPARRAALRAARVAMVLFFIILWHKNVLVFDVAYQTLFVFVIGFVAYWERQAALAGAASRRGAGLRPAAVGRR